MHLQSDKTKLRYGALLNLCDKEGKAAMYVKTDVQ